MKKVVVTGLGALCSIGKNLTEVANSLRAGKSGIQYSTEYEELGFRSRVYAPVEIDFKENIDRKTLRFMGDAAAYAYLAMAQAVADSGFEADQISNPRFGLVAGSGGASTANNLLATDLLREKGVRKVGPYMVTRTMGSTVSACLSTSYKIQGVSYSISSACATSVHCAGNGAELIQSGKQDVVFVGGAEELHWTQTVLFDAMGALSSKYNDNPSRASRAFDANRDGFVISGGGGMMVLEELEHAQKRGARIYAEVVGYGASSDGYDMVAPSGEGAQRCMRSALATVEGEVDYINAHGTSTPAGDIKELEAVRAVFGEKIPNISSTKSLTGHSLGAAGVHEVIYSLLMMRDGFIAGSANIDELDPAAEGFPIVRETTDKELNIVMSNSFGFGGTNGSLVLQKWPG